MEYNELPNWAKKEAKQTVKKWLLEDIEERRMYGDDVKDYTENQLEMLAMDILNDLNCFEIEYDDYGRNARLNF